MDEQVTARFRDAIERIRGAGIHVLMLSGANPTDHIPIGKVFDARGARLTAALVDLADLPGVTFVDNFNDQGLRDIRYWSPDKLHLNALGHARVASNVLTGLGIAVPVEWGVAEVAAAPPGPEPQHRRLLPRVRAAVDRPAHHRPLVGRRASREACDPRGARTESRLSAPTTADDAPAATGQTMPSTSATKARVRRASPSMRSSSCTLGSTSDGAARAAEPHGLLAGEVAAHVGADVSPRSPAAPARRAENSSTWSAG